MASPSGISTPNGLPVCLLALFLLAVVQVQPSAAASRKNSTSRGVSASSSSGGPLVVCYYTNWSVYRPGRAKYTPPNVNPYLCTHLIYAFGGLSSEDGLRPYDKYQDIEQGGYAKFNGLKSYNRALKTLLAVGGWNEGSARFSALAADPERRTKFAKGAVRFLRTHRFDGLDLDWEFPAFRDGGRPQDKENYAKLAEDLRAEFDKESSQTGRPRLLLTMAVPAGKEYIDRGFDMTRLSPQLDFLNILSYDYHSAFEPVVNHHSPLYPLNRVEGGSEYDYDGELCIDFTVRHYLKAGVPPSQLILGIPTYGRSYTLLNPESTEPGSPADGPGAQGDATREKGYLSYYEICKAVKSEDWIVEQPDAGAMGPYAFKGDQWVGYDDPDTIRKKAHYVHEMSLGGLMFWSVDNDDFRGDCHGKPYPLVEAGKEELLRLAGPPSKGTNKGSNRVSGSTGGNRRRPTSGGGGRKRRPSTTSTTTSTTTTTTPSYGSLTTPEPPTTPDPGSDFVCKDEGFFPHPRDCKKYFWCLDSGPSSLGIVAHQFTCPSGLFFNKAADSCDYSRNVLCKKKLVDSASTTTKAPATSAGTTTTRRTTARTTTTTTTTTTEAPEYDYEEEEEEDGSLEEDPSALKELIGLIKKLGGLKELERQLEPSNSGSKGTTSSPININKGSSSLYERVLGSRGKRPPPVLNARRPPPPATTTASSVRPALKYVSLRRERPAKVEPEEQEEEFDDEEVEEEVAPKEEGNTRKQNFGNTRVFAGERPKYVTINRPRPSTTPQPQLEEEEEEVVGELEEPEPEVGTPRYVTIRRPRPTRVTEPEFSTPRYQIIDRRRFGGESTQEKTSESVVEIEEKTTAFPSTTSTPIHSSSFSSIAASASPSLLSSPDSSPSIFSTTTAPATVTRVITSVTEAATERQVIAVARVPYSVLLGARAASNRTTETTTPTTTTTEKAISTSRRPLFAPRGNTLALGRRRVTTTRRKIIVPSARLGDEKPESLPTTVLAAAPLVGEERKVPAIRGTVRQKDITPDIVIGGKGVDDVEDKRDGDIFEESEEVIVEVTSKKPAIVRRPSTRRPTSYRATSSPNSPRTVVTSLPRRLSTTRRPTTQQSEDDDYYFDLPSEATSGKVRVRVDGTVQCLDRGNFPHPLAFSDDNISPSCNRRFVSCAEVEGNILGWEYECPRHLTFDPIGGICNWAPEGLGCD
ncbi:oviduct-specific glycoprotein [Hetaerina americana]|uniref:oviduct-specific glycoprotein n=1 Tax=Hetaerina americana TaxID=62018 RepID=UPI003A7F263E